MRQRLKADVSKKRLLAAALEIAETVGFHRMTRADIAAHADVSPGLVSLHLGTMDALRRSVMRAAIKRESLKVIAEGLALGNSHARAADPELKARALASLSA